MFSCSAKNVEHPFLLWRNPQRDHPLHIYPKRGYFSLRFRPTDKETKRILIQGLQDKEGTCTSTLPTCSLARDQKQNLQPSLGCYLFSPPSPTTPSPPTYASSREQSKPSTTPSAPTKITAEQTTRPAPPMDSSHHKVHLFAQPSSN